MITRDEAEGLEWERDLLTAIFGPGEEGHSNASR